VSGYFTRRVKVCLITEDYYALDLIEKIIRRIKSEGIIKQDVVLYKSESSKGKSKLLSKLHRLIAVMRDFCDKVLIFIDADGESVNEVRRRFRIKSSNTFLIVFDYEIEEWILPNTPHPSRELKRRELYEKYMLPDYAEKVDLDKVRNLRSFKEFINALNDP